MKKKLTLSIDEKVLESATEQIPNISKFVEDCLREFLGLNPGNYPTKTAHDIIDNIGRNQVDLHILNEQNKITENIQKMEEDKVDRFWRELYLKYRDTYVITDEMKELAKELLDVDLDTLENILDSIDDNNLMFNTWTEAKQWYGDNQ